jgi:phage terminase large subunit-like protein
LAPKEPIALGFDGAKYRDGTALIASRMSDARLFELRVWLRPPDAPKDWRVPSAEVDKFVADVFGAYQVAVMFADPYRWQDYLDAWANKFGAERVVEFPTNQEQRMDRAIERFSTAFNNLEITHDGSSIMTAHFKNAVLVKGARKKSRPGEEAELALHYMKLAKRGDGLLIDASVAGVLAHEARAHAIEKDMTPQSQPFFGAWR